MKRARDFDAADAAGSLESSRLRALLAKEKQNLEIRLQEIVHKTQYVMAAAGCVPTSVGSSRIDTVDSMLKHFEQNKTSTALGVLLIIIGGDNGLQELRDWETAIQTGHVKFIRTMHLKKSVSALREVVECVSEFQISKGSHEKEIRSLTANCASLVNDLSKNAYGIEVPLSSRARTEEISSRLLRAKKEAMQVSPFFSIGGNTRSIADPSLTNVRFPDPPNPSILMSPASADRLMQDFQSLMKLCSEDLASSTNGDDEFERFLVQVRQCKIVSNVETFALDVHSSTNSNGKLAAAAAVDVMDLGFLQRLGQWWRIVRRACAIACVLSSLRQSKKGTGKKNSIEARYNALIDRFKQKKGSVVPLSQNDASESFCSFQQALCYENLAKILLVLPRMVYQTVFVSIDEWVGTMSTRCLQEQLKDAMSEEDLNFWAKIDNLETREEN